MQYSNLREEPKFPFLQQNQLNENIKEKIGETEDKFSPTMPDSVSIVINQITYKISKESKLPIVQRAIPKAMSTGILEKE
jgi:hypothetical protein